MRYLVDTHILLWSAYEHHKLTSETKALLDNEENEFWFSAVSLWEVALKRARNRSDFVSEPGPLRMKLLENGYEELAIHGPHILAWPGTATGHFDPFDRLLLAQATVEGMELLSGDRELAKYTGPLKFVG